MTRSHLRAFGALFLLLFLGLLAGCSAVKSAIDNNNPGGGVSGVPAIQHVVIVVLENQNYADVVGNASMPYLNGLANHYSLATQFYADAHPSIGNYFMMTTGQLVTIDDNFSGSVGADNVARELTQAGKSWRVYAESLPSTGYVGGDVYPYVRHHNPFSYFTDVTGNANQASNMVSFSQFAADVSAGTLPNYSFVIPNDIDNGHDCAPNASSCQLNDKLITVDTWLKANIGPLTSNSALMANTLVIVTFDESASDINHVGGRIPVVLAGSHVKLGYQSTTFYQSESLLRLTMQTQGVANVPGGGANATQMGEFFQ